MKSLVVLFIALSTVTAHAGLKSYTAKVTRSGFNYTCSLVNKTENTMDIKNVFISFEGVSYDRPTTYQRIRLDQRVRTGETAKYTMNVSPRQTVTMCSFEVR